MKRKKIIRLTENDLNRIVKKVINEAYEGGIIQEGDDSCEIRCKRKLAKNGSNGDVVKYIQHLLAANGFNPKYEGGGMGLECSDLYQGCDGKYRRHTKDAVREFQREYGLTPDGVVGYNTLMKMCEVFKPKRGLTTQNVKAYDLLCKDCDCEKQRDTPIMDDPIGGQDPSIPKIGVDIDCDDLRNCVDKYIFGSVVPDFDNFLTCLYKGDPNKKDRPPKQGCITDDGRDKCGIIPTDIPPGMATTANVGYYYDPKQGKCVRRTMGGGPFSQMEKCRECCERK